jgi:hypothetical protein
VPLDSGIDECVVKTLLRERCGLCFGPAVTGESSGAWSRSPFDRHQPAGWF